MITVGFRIRMDKFALQLILSSKWWKQWWQRILNLQFSHHHHHVDDNKGRVVYIGLNRTQISACMRKRKDKYPRTLKIVCRVETFVLFRTPHFEWRKWDNGFRVRCGYRNDNSQCFSPRLLYPLPGFCWFEFLSGYGNLLSFLCAVLSCLDKCLALRRRKC